MKASARNLSAVGITALGLVACSSGGDDDGANLAVGATGKLSLSITDAPVDAVESIVVHFTGVRLKPQNGPAIDIPFVDENGNPVTHVVDMLELTNGTYEDLFLDAEVPAGVYNWIQLEVLADTANGGDSHVMSNGAQYELRIPSSEQNGLRFVSPFTVTADGQTHLLLDWDMRMALIRPPGQDGIFMLRPAFRLIDMTEHGLLTGSVAAELIDAAGCEGDTTIGAGNAVYVYDAADLVGTDGTPLEPGDIGSTSHPAPVATGVVEFDAASGAYGFRVILSPGEYRVAYTCDGDADEVETDDDVVLLLAPDTVAIENGQTASVDFPSVL
ncbi:MAG TPA: DUF4382 domain-containing protein [Gammaproteobacteria bacterium]